MLLLTSGEVRTGCRSGDRLCWLGRGRLALALLLLLLTGLLRHSGSGLRTLAISFLQGLCIILRGSGKGSGGWKSHHVVS
jgi:hypothetical protein